MADNAYGPFPTEQKARSVHPRFAILRQTPEGWFVFLDAGDAIGHYTTRAGVKQ